MVTSKRKRWSQRVTEKSHALDLEEGVFAKDDPRSIARSLKRSAERSVRRKSDLSLRDVDAYVLYKSRSEATLAVQAQAASGSERRTS